MPRATDKVTLSVAVIREELAICAVIGDDNTAKTIRDFCEKFGIGIDVGLLQKDVARIKKVYDRLPGGHK